jgi:hypothetical protein
MAKGNWRKSVIIGDNGVSGAGDERKRSHQDNISKYEATNRRRRISIENKANIEENRIWRVMWQQRLYWRKIAREKQRKAGENQWKKIIIMAAYTERNERRNRRPGEENNMKWQ